MLENRKNVRKKFRDILIALIAIMMICGAFIKWWPEAYAAIELENGTINPIYRPKWTKVESTLDKTNQTMSVVVKGSAYESQTTGGVSINYASDVTSTLEAKDITVYINGVEVTVPTNPKVTVSEGSTTTNDTSKKKEVTHTIVLSNLEEAARQAGLNYTEWSGNISLKIGGRGEDESTYDENVLTDDYGNQNMAESDEKQEDGSWIDITFGDTATDHNTDGIMFADFVKPEFTYVYAGTTRDENPSADPDINYDNKTVKIVFSTVDKYFYVPTEEEIAAGQTNKLEIGDLIIKIDGEEPQWKDEEGTEDEHGNTGVVKTLTSEAITEERTKADGTKETVTIGYQYTLTLSELQQKAIKLNENYLDYSGVVTVTIPEGKIKDKSGNTNNGQTITSGIDLPGQIPTTSYTNPYLPDGFNYVEGDLNTGIVIADGAGNEYVWVEVPKTTDVYRATTLALDIENLTGTALTNAYTAIEEDLHAYTMDYRKDADGNEIAYKDEYPDDATVKAATGINTVGEYTELKQKMLKSIFLNGGFYVGRYETGYDYNDASGIRSEATDTTNQKAVIKPNTYPYSLVTTSQAQELSKTFAPSGYTSNLMFGVQWDLIIKYLETKGNEQQDLITDTTSWGNYKNNLWNLTNANAKYIYDGGSEWITEPLNKTSEDMIMLTTGAIECFSKQNISDLVGNLWEWTLEYSADSSNPCTIRGASYMDDGSNMEKTSTVRKCLSNTYNWGHVGFRVALYKDGAAEAVEPQVVDVVNPVWWTSAPIIDKEKQIVSIDIYTSDKYFKESTLKNEDIQMFVDGIDVSTLANVNPKLSNPTPLTEVRNGQVSTIRCKIQINNNRLARSIKASW